MLPEQPNANPKSRSPSPEVGASRSPAVHKKVQSTATNNTKGGIGKNKAKLRKSFSRSIYAVLKDVQRSMHPTDPEIGISSQSMSMMNSFMNNMFDQIAAEAGRQAEMNGKKTITTREIQTAVRKILPGQVATHAVAEGTKAVVRYTATA